MSNTILDTELSKKKNDGEELAEILSKLPEAKRERVYGIIEGIALSERPNRAAG